MRDLYLWVQGYPFSHDTLKEVPLIVKKYSFMASLYDKSGYDNIFWRQAVENVWVYSLQVYGVQ